MYAWYGDKSQSTPWEEKGRRESDSSNILAKWHRAALDIMTSMHTVSVRCCVTCGMVSLLIAAPNFCDLRTSLAIDVDGAPNAYGPSNKQTLDYELNAHRGGKSSGAIVGYLTKKDGRTPEVQGAGDPFPGYYISTTAFHDVSNHNRLDTGKYVDASRINYVVLGKFASRNGAKLGDFVAVHSLKTRRSVFGIIGDSGNPAGSEGSLALVRALGYDFQNAKRGGVPEELIIRYFPGSNPNRHFFKDQAQIDREAEALALSKEF